MDDDSNLGGETDLMELANRQVELAKGGDFRAGTEIVIQSAIAIRDFLKGDPPEAYRLVFLRSLLESLDAIQGGDDPLDALSLRKPSHRPPDIYTDIRNAHLFYLVGEEFDRLTVERGHTRQDKPTDNAIEKVAKDHGLSTDVVAKAWRNLGGATGWGQRNSDWK